MALDFPSSPANGQVFSDATSGLTYVYINNYSYWAVATGPYQTAGGSNTSIQFNSSGNMNGNTNFVWNNDQQNMTIGNSTVNSTMNSVSTFSSLGFQNPQNLLYSYTTPANVNTILAGPYTVNTGFTLTVTSGTRIVIV